MWNWKGCYLCDNSDKNPKMKILCPQKFYLSVNSNPVQIKIAVLVTHGDHGTSGSDKIAHVVNTRFFLRIFFPAHFDHWKLRKSFWWVVVVGGGGGKNDSRVISLVKESKLLAFSYLNESDLESTLTNLDQELDNNVDVDDNVVVVENIV